MFVVTPSSFDTFSWLVLFEFHICLPCSVSITVGPCCLLLLADVRIAAERRGCVMGIAFEVVFEPDRFMVCVSFVLSP